MAETRRFSSLPLALALSIALLLLSAIHAVGKLDILFRANSAMSKTLDLQFMGTPLGAAVIRFVAALTVLHLALGGAVWLLARLTEYAFPAWRISRSALVVMGFTLLCAWVLVASATMYPWSGAGVAAPFWSSPVFGTVTLYDVLSIAILTWVAAAIVGAIKRRGVPLRLCLRVVVYSSLAVATVLTGSALMRGFDSNVAPTRPNVIVIGIDSLRPDVVAGSNRIGVTPNIDNFLRDAVNFSDAVTPLARTFASWMAILSGEYSRHTGVRENLMHPQDLTLGDTLQTTLRESGYLTMYATDETRFSNIDQSYGFDHVVGPTMGAADFALAELNDFPLTNVFSNTIIARYLFPATYANRAAANTYRPTTFIKLLTDRLDDVISEAEPLFLSVHLTLPHAPFHHADAVEDIFNPGTDKLYGYLESVIAVDRQLGELLEQLEARGLLRNAIVVLLSDHGEALGRPGLDSVISGAEGQGVLEGTQVGLWGHGTSVLSLPQFKVVLAFKGYGPSAFASVGRESSAAASLVDLEPTLLDLLKMKGSQTDGLSLLPLLKSSAASQETFNERVRFTETGIAAPLDGEGEVDDAAVKRSAALFRMNPENGRVELRRETLPAILASKERAALRGHWLLAALPAKAGQSGARLILIDRTGTTPPRRLQELDAEPDEIRLMADALRAHYADELLAND